MASPDPGASKPLLDIKNLSIELGHPPRVRRVVDGVSLTINRGETLCLVGESGCGKTITALSIARLLPSPPAAYPEGEIWLEGKEVLKMPPAELRSIRGKVVSYVFQEPAASLHPTQRIGNQIGESLEIHRSTRATHEEVIHLLDQVGIPAPETRIRHYPHQLSGGMQQRVMIAMALASQPRLLVADEPTTALDVTIQAQILELLRRLRQQLGMSILMITHNLEVAGELADRIAVMYAGQVVELGAARELLEHPSHPYTRGLLQSMPRLGTVKSRLTNLPGQVPSAGAFPAGCRFHPRCPLARKECSWSPPALDELHPRHWSRCPFACESNS